MVLRSRQTDVDIALLAAAGTPSVASRTEAARSVVLNLFRDTEYVAFLDRVETVPTIGYAWVGQLAGIEGSRVVLAIADGVLSGSIELPTHFYSVTLRDGSYVVAEVKRPVSPIDDAVPMPPEALADARASRVAAAVDSGDVYDLLLYYTSGAKSEAGGTAAVNALITAAITRVNDAYIASGISTRVRLVAAIESGYVDTQSLSTDLTALRTSSEVRTARERYGADIVTMLVARGANYSGSSGVGYVSVSQGLAGADYGYNVTVYYSFLGYIFALAHEIGHNQGSLHEPGNNSGDDTSGAYLYSLGYTDTVHKFYDLMSYGLGCTNCAGLNQFSSPVHTYQGYPVGTAGQDNVRSINNTRTMIANYRPSSACAVTIPQTTLPSMTQGVAYSTTITASGGTAPYSFSVTAGGLPAGVTLTSAGVLAGTPATSGTFAFTIRATDANGCVASVAYTIVIAATPGCRVITIPQTTLPNMTLGVAYGTTITASGGTAPYTFSVTAGTLPSGMTLTAAGVLAGTPTTAGTFAFTIRATDASGCFASVAYTMVIATTPCPVITVSPTTVPNMTLGVAYSTTITASGGTSPYTFSVTAGALPGGVTLTSAGVLAGTPTTAGTFTFTIRGTAANGCFGSLAYTIIVTALPLPGAPSGLIADSFGGRVQLTWAAPTTGSAPTAYVIEVGSAIGATDLVSLNTFSTATTYSVSNVGEDTYFLRVRASNSVGTGAPSNEAILIVGRGCGSPPAAPTGLSVSSSGGTVTLSWTAPVGNPPTSYVLEAGSTSGASNLKNIDLRSTATSTVGEGVPSGQYFIRIRARNACGIGPSSNELLAFF